MNLNLNNLSFHDLDNLALTGTPIATLSQNERWEPKKVGDYEAVFLAMRPAPVVILKGVTPRGKNMVWKGKVNRLLDAGCCLEIALKAPSHPCGLEPMVWKLAEKLLRHGRKLAKVNNMDDFHRLTGGRFVDHHPVFLKKVYSAVQIAKEAAEFVGQEIEWES